MIVADASAPIAILDREDDAARYAAAIAEADAPLISAGTLTGCQVENVTARHAQLALEAYAMYGKGQKGKAGLNYGDCFSYALAKATGLPLLFKGNDFSKTDLQPALSRD